MNEGWARAFGHRRSEVIQALVEGYGVEDMLLTLNQDEDEIRRHIAWVKDRSMMPSIVSARNAVMRRQFQ